MSDTKCKSPVYFVKILVLIYAVDATHLPGKHAKLKVSGILKYFRCLFNSESRAIQTVNNAHCT